MPQAKDYARKKIKQKTKELQKTATKQLEKYVSTQMSEIKKNVSGSKQRAEVKDYTGDTYARLSSLAYEKDRGKLQKEARKMGYDIDEELSSNNHTVFKHRQTGKAVISYRGTEPTNLDDLAADKDIAYGKREHSRFNEALHVAKKAQQKYKDIEVTGHSLGGTQALHVYETLGVRTRVYNPGSTPKGQKLKLHSSGITPEIVRHEDDVISLGYAPYATETYKHSEHTPFQYPDLLKAHNIPGQK
jgi:hypothetical protein